MAKKKEGDSEETTPVAEVKGEETKISIIEYGIMKKIMHNYYKAFEMYCIKNQLHVPKTFFEWDEEFEKFKNLR